MFEALDLNLSVWAALLLEAVIAIGVSLPAGPGYVGNFEYATTLGLGLFGIPREKAVAYALLAHSLQLIPVMLVGLMFAIRMRIGFYPQSQFASAAMGDRSLGAAGSRLGGGADIPGEPRSPS
jgi:hypothetical protein